MIKKSKRDKLFRLRLEGDVVEFKTAIFKGVNKETIGEIMRPYWRDAKRQERETRCLKADGKTRCDRNCSECSQTRGGQLLSMDQMEEDGMPPQDGFSVEAYIEQKELYQALYAAIDTLEEKDRQIILLIFWGGRSEREIEADVGLKQSAINSRKHNALKKLKELLQDFG